TRSPGVPAIRLAAAGDYAAFAEAEMREREELFYPPFTRFCIVTFRGTVREAVEAYAARFADAVGRGDPRWILGDPVPAAVERANGAWRFQITLRGEDSRLLHERLRAAFAVLTPPGDIVAAADVDALC
ncbi:MAG: hypothetical protein IJ783_06345, partial [Kiritimatiellae bacterium]|nr:hypothetical protein [Kiritimatiellia bacterium]